MAKKTNNEKNSCQTSLDFNQKNGTVSGSLNKDCTKQNNLAKVIYFDPRQEIYKKILNRQMR